MKALAKTRVGILICLLLSLPYIMLAQNGLESTLNTVKGWMVSIGHVVFVMIIIMGIFRTITAFVFGNPNAVRFLIYLIIAALIWFGFSVLVDDLRGLGGIENI